MQTSSGSRTVLPPNRTRNRAMGDWRTVIILTAAILLVADEIYENRTGKELFEMPPRVARWLILFTAAWMVSDSLI